MQGLKENYHTHTIRCHHAIGADEEYVISAINSGVKVLGFSDHSPYPMPGGYVTSYRLSKEDAIDYVSSLTSLREKYRDKIKILIGFEAEYYKSYFNDLLELYKQLNIDYVILGQHCVGEELRGGCDSFSPRDSVEWLRLYVDQVCEGMRSGFFTYLAHPDCINFRGNTEIYLENMARICSCAKELEIPLEINLLGLSAGRHYPRHEFWQLAKEYGNTVIIGSDAHSPDRVSIGAEYERAMREIVIPNGLNLITTPNIRRPY